MNWIWKCSNPDCGKEFERKQPGQKFCCPECGRHARYLRECSKPSRPRGRTLIREEECLVCGSIFPLYKGYVEKKFCSRACYHVWLQDNACTKHGSTEPELHDPWKMGRLPRSVTENSLAC